ncbi:cupin domain-containing protein [Lacinutrix cladophorae]
MRHFFYFIIIFLIFSCKQKTTLPDPLQAGWQGESVCEMIHEDKQVRVLKCTFAPGVGHEKHEHQPHFGYTLKGGTFKIKDTSGTKTVHVKTGTSWSKDKVTQHEVLNVGDSTSVYLIIEYK